MVVRAGITELSALPMQKREMPSDPLEREVEEVDWRSRRTASSVTGVSKKVTLG